MLRPDRQATFIRDRGQGFERIVCQIHEDSLELIDIDHRLRRAVIEEQAKLNAIEALAV